MNGVLVIDKPAGPTSFDVVHQVRRLLGLKKVGHTGTLDPMATGVLPICLGEATKIAGYLTENSKTYVGTMRLGVTTDTQDALGEVTSQRSIGTLSTEQIQNALAEFSGTFDQVPPMYSAIKINGQRLYDLARKGVTVEREARQVTVHSLQLLSFDGAFIQFQVHCSKGFYVRTLAQDVGEKLGCGAHLTALRRTQSGRFSLGDAVALDSLSKASPPVLMSLSNALQDIPSVEVDSEMATKIFQGKPLEVIAPRTGVFRIVSKDETLLALAESVAEPLPALRYLRVFPSLSLLGSA